MADKQIGEALQLLRGRLQGFMVKKRFSSRLELSKYLGISSKTIDTYFAKKNPSLPSAETLQKLRDKIPEITDGDAKILETAYSRKGSLYRSSGTKIGAGEKHGLAQTVSTAGCNTVRQAIAPFTSDDRDARIGQLVRELMSEVVQNGCTHAAFFDPMTLLGSHAAQRYQIGDMASVLTKANFQTIDVSGWSEVEQEQFLSYANLVLEESRKCMTLLAQFMPDQVRTVLLKRVAQNADLLWRTYKAASSVAPIQYVQDIDLEHTFSV